MEKRTDPGPLGFGVLADAVIGLAWMVVLLLLAVAWLVASLTWALLGDSPSFLVWAAVTAAASVGSYIGLKAVRRIARRSRG